MVSACEYYDRYLSGLDYGVWWVGLGHELTRGLGGRHGLAHIQHGMVGRGFGGVGLVGFAGLTCWAILIFFKTTNLIFFIFLNKENYIKKFLTFIFVWGKLLFESMCFMSFN
ncbi:hypothetical protein HanIR_Chr09g0411921 [Helianthus annuus]|nr:hypothetical protein HanIR_Chr09g0411921 [Helianthus annuus]